MEDVKLPMSEWREPPLATEEVEGERERERKQIKRK